MTSREEPRLTLGDMFGDMLTGGRGGRAAGAGGRDRDRRRGRQEEDDEDLTNLDLEEDIEEPIEETEEDAPDKE